MKLERENNANRIAWIDQAKGIGIISVIAGHIVLPQVRIWLFSFHVPLFFFISGFLFNPNKPFKLFLKRKVQTLLVPLFSMGLILLLYSILSGEYGAADFIKDFLIQKRFTSMWFFTCIFLMELLYFFLFNTFQTVIETLLITIGLFLCGVIYGKTGGAPLIWNIDVVLTGCVFFFFGWLSKKYINVFDSFFASQKKLVLQCVLFLLLSILFSIANYRLSGEFLDLFHNRLGCIPVTLLSALFGIAFAVSLAKVRTERIFGYIGSNSIVYFSLHQFMLIPLSERILDAVGIERNWSTLLSIAEYDSLMFLCTVFLATAINMLLIHTPLKIMLGKGWSDS